MTLSPLSPSTPKTIASFSPDLSTASSVFGTYVRSSLPSRSEDSRRPPQIPEKRVHVRSRLLICELVALVILSPINRFGLSFRSSSPASRSRATASSHAPARSSESACSSRSELFTITLSSQRRAREGRTRPKVARSPRLFRCRFQVVVVSACS